MIAVIDNYDSFTWNLVQIVGKMEPDLKIFRNDEIDLPALRTLDPDGLIISPGPGRPEDAGRLLEILSGLIGEIPILGICLGHQAIALCYGASVTYAARMMHGKQSEVSLDPGCPLFAGLSSCLKVGRYHSLAVDPSTLPAALKAAAWTDQGELMAVMDEEKQVYGLQFHPESILSPQGPAMLAAFVDLVRQRQPEAARRKETV